MEKFPPTRMGHSSLWACASDTFLLSCLLGRPCACSEAGSLGTCDPHSGRCPCKENVEGHLCDRWATDPTLSLLGVTSGLVVEEGGQGPYRPGRLHHLAPFLGHPGVCRPGGDLKVLTLFILFYKGLLVRERE